MGQIYVSSSEPWGKSPLTDSIMFSPWAIYTPPIKRGGPSPPIFLFSTYSSKALLAQRATSSIKQLEQLFLSIATTPLCCQHWGRQVQTTFQRDSAVLNRKSSCGHWCSIKKWPWPSEDVLILQFPSPTATCCNSREIPAQNIPRKTHPNDIFFQVLTTGMDLHPIDASLWVFNTAEEQLLKCSHEPDFINCSYTLLCPFR